MPKFKVGDRVRTNPKWEYSANYNGSEGTIIKISYEDDETKYHVSWDKFLHHKDGIKNSLENLEKIEDEPKSWTETKLITQTDFNKIYRDRLIGKYTVGMDFSDRYKSSFSTWSELYSYKPNESMTQKVTKTMSSIIKKIKDIKLSQDDRLLRKHDFENDNGEMMEEARDLMLDEILTEKWKTRRLEIAADLKLVEQSEK